MVDSRIIHNPLLHKKTEVKSKFSNKAVTNFGNKDKNGSNKDLVFSDEFKQKNFVNPPFYNFIYAEEELGFSFSEFAKNNFSDFLSNCYITDLINLRKNYIMRNMSQVRFIAHKFKSPFGLISSLKVKEACENLQNAIEVGKFDVEDEYIKVLETLGAFLNEFHQFSKNLSHSPLKLDLEFNKDLMKQFIELNDKCNQMEDPRIKAGLMGDTAFESIT